MTIRFVFKCPNCGGTTLQETVTEVVQHSVVDSIENEGGESFRCNYGAVDYSTDLADGVEAYGCNDCSYVLTDECGVVTSEEDLFAWLFKHGMLADEAC